MTLSPLGRKAQQVAQAVAARGGRAFLVGGYVRDSLLGATPKDADLEVYGLEAPLLKEVLAGLGRVGAVGESFKVYKLSWHKNGERYELDVSLPRRDKKVGEGHKGFEIEGDPQASPEDAARRRDFTVNAILQDPLSGEIVDPFGGREDLRRGLLRVVDARHFAEDSLRVLRAVQFAARFEMVLDPATTELCRGIELSDLPRERVWGEVEKWLLKSARPSIGLQAAHDLKVLGKLFPYLETALARRGEALAATLDRAAAERLELPVEKQIVLMLAVLGVFLGWHDTTRLLEDLNIHRMRGGDQSLDVRKAVIQLVGKRKTPADWQRKPKVRDEEFRWFSAQVEPRLAVKLARCRGEFAAADWFEAQLARLGVLDGPPQPLLLGRHLLEMGLKPGPRVGELVQTVYARQLAGEVTTLGGARALARTLLETDL